MQKNTAQTERERQRASIPPSYSSRSMADTSATIRLKAIDQNVASTLGNLNSLTGNLGAAFTGLQFGFGALEKASRSSVAQLALGVDASERMAGALGKVATSGGVVSGVLGKLGDIAFLGGQFATAAQGAAGMAEQLTRIPQALAQFQASGVSTKPIEDFNLLTDAVKGSGASIDSFVTTAIAQLSEFESASQRIGTILRSPTRFNAAGEAERSNRTEQMQNALQVQKLVNEELDNSVTSTAALASQYDVLSSGFTSAADSQKVLAAGLKLVGIGEAGGQSAPVSATTRLLTTTMNAYELTADRAAETAGVINGIVEAGITTIPEMLDLGATAKQASAAGVSLKDLAAGVSVLTVQGVNTAESLTGLSSLSANIIDKTPEAQEALDKLTLSGQKIRFDKTEIQSKGLVQALIDLNKAAGGSAQTLSQIFPDQVTFRTVLALLAQSGEKLKGLREGFDTAGAQSLDEVFKLAKEDRIPRMEKIANRFQEAIIQVAASLAPVLEPGLAALETLANTFNALPDSVKQGIGAWIAAQVQFKAGTAAIGIFANTLKSLAQNYLLARGTSLLFTGQLGKEIGVIRELFTQRKGLLAVGLQIFGIDQKWRLTSQEATEALTKQSAAANILTNARTKLSEVVGKNVQGFQQQNSLTAQTTQQLKQTGGAIASQATGALTSGLATATKEETRKAAIATSEDLWKATKERAARAAQEIGRSAQTIGAGLSQAVGGIPSPQLLGPDGKPLSTGGMQSVRAEFQKIGGTVASAAQNTFAGLKEQFGQKLPVPDIDPAGVGEKAKAVGTAIASNITNPDAVKQRMGEVSQVVSGKLNELTQKANLSGLKEQLSQKLPTPEIDITGVGEKAKAVGSAIASNITNPDAVKQRMGEVSRIVTGNLDEIKGASDFSGLVDQFGKPLSAPDIDATATQQKAKEVGNSLTTNLANPDAIKQRLGEVTQTVTGKFEELKQKVNISGIREQLAQKLPIPDLDVTGAREKAQSVGNVITQGIIDPSAIEQRMNEVPQIITGNLDEIKAKGDFSGLVDQFSKPLPTPDIDTSVLEQKTRIIAGSLNELKQEGNFSGLVNQFGQQLPTPTLDTTDLEQKTKTVGNSLTQNIANPDAIKQRLGEVRQSVSVAFDELTEKANLSGLKKQLSQRLPAPELNVAGVEEKAKSVGKAVATNIANPDAIKQRLSDVTQTVTGSLSELNQKVNLSGLKEQLTQRLPIPELDATGVGEKAKALGNVITQGITNPSAIEQRMREIPRIVTGNLDEIRAKSNFSGLFDQFDKPLATPDIDTTALEQKTRIITGSLDDLRQKSDLSGLVDQFGGQLQTPTLDTTALEQKAQAAGNSLTQNIADPDAIKQRLGEVRQSVSVAFDELTEKVNLSGLKERLSQRLPTPELNVAGVEEKTKSIGNAITANITNPDAIKQRLSNVTQTVTGSLNELNQKVNLTGLKEKLAQKLPIPELDVTGVGEKAKAVGNAIAQGIVNPSAIKQRMGDVSQIVIGNLDKIKSESDFSGLVNQFSKPLATPDIDTAALEQKTKIITGNFSELQQQSGGLVDRFNKPLATPDIDTAVLEQKSKIITNSFGELQQQSGGLVNRFNKPLVTPDIDATALEQKTRITASGFDDLKSKADFSGLVDQFGQQLPTPEFNATALEQKAKTIGNSLTQNIANPNAIKQRLNEVTQTVTGRFEELRQKVDLSGLKAQLAQKLPIPELDATGVGEKAKSIGNAIAQGVANPDAIKQRMDEVGQAVTGKIDSLKQKVSFSDLREQLAKPLPIPQLDVAAAREKAKNIGDSITKNITNPDAIKQRFNEVGQAVTGKLDELKQKINLSALTDRFKQPIPVPALDPSGIGEQAKGIGASLAANVASGMDDAQAQLLREQEAMAAQARTLQTTSELSNRDIEVRQRSTQASKDRTEWLRLESEAQNKSAQASELSARVEAQSIELTEKQSRATQLFLNESATREEKQKALNEALKQEQSLESERTRLQSIQSEAESLSAQATEAKAKAMQSSNASVQARIAAEKRLEPVARAMVQADTAAATAAQAKQAATVAAAQAAQLEATLGAQDERVITARTQAKNLETQASNLQALATERATKANALYRAEARASELAEKGLAETRLFGQNITFATGGPLGSLNKLLATEIGLKGAATAATNSYNAAQSGAGRALGGLTKILSGDLSQLRSGLLKTGEASKGAFNALGSGAKGAFGLAKGGISTLLQPLGLFAPLAIAGGVAALAFRDDISGMGAAVRDASKSFDEFQKKQTELERQLQGQAGLSQLREQTKALINDSTYIGESTKRATQAGQTVQRGFVESALSLPGDAFSNVTGTVGNFFGGIGKNINNAANQELTNVAVPAAEKLKPFRTELDKLRESGGVTSGQFALLSKSLNDVGASGDINKEKLKDFKVQLDAVMQGAQGVAEEGIMDKIWGSVKNVPSGLLDVFDNLANVPAALIGQSRQVLTGEQGLGGAAADLFSGKAFQESKGEREADRLVKPISEIGIALDRVGNASVNSQEAIGRYNKGLAITADVSEKIRKGTRLTASDLEGENEAFKNRQKINEGLVVGLTDQIKKYEEIGKSIKDPEQKAVFQGRIDSLRQELSGLEKRNQKLKEANDFLNKYQTETLPNLIQALNESSDPAKALRQAGDTFKQQFQTDAKGKVTPFIKDIATLRTESQRYQTQITDALATGEFDTKIEASYGVKVVPGQGEAEAARRLQEVRDNQIKYLEDGVQKSGFRLGVSDRKALTQQISELQNEGLKQQEAAGNLEIERTKNLRSAQVQGAAETEDKIAAIQRANLNRQLKQRENEVAEYKKAGFRTVDLENQAAQLRIQVEAAEIEQRDKLRQRALDRRLKGLDLEAEKIKTAQARRTVTGEEAEEKLADVQGKQAQLRLDQLKAERAKRTKPDPDLNNQIAQAQEQIAQTEAQRDENRRQRRIKRREADFNLEQDRIKLAVAARTTTQDEAERQSSQIEKQAAQARLKDLEEINKRSGGRDVDLAREISKQRLEVERLTVEAIEKERQRLIRNRDGELEVEKAQLQARMANRTATQEEGERESTRIEQEAAQNRIKDLELLYNKSGRRDVALGQDLAKARAEAERLSGEAIEKERQRQISRRNAGFEIEEAQSRLSLSKRLVSQRDAEQQTDEIQIRSAQARLADLEELYNKSGRRDVDLANDISKARLEVEQKTAEAINREREFQFAQNQARIKNETQAEVLLRQQALNQGQIEQKDLEIRNKYLDDAKNLISAQNQATEAQLQNVSKLTGDTVARADIERQLAENRLVNLGQQQQFERQSIENQKTIVQITSDREVAQARLQQLENRRDLMLAQNELAKARRERRPEEEIRTIELQVQGLEQQNSLIDQQVGQAERSRQQQLDSLDNQRQQLDLTQATARENAQIEAAQARIGAYQATLVQAAERVSLAEQARQQGLQQSQKTNEAIGKGLEQQLGYLEAQAKAVNARTEFATGELSLAADLTKNDTERKNIAVAIADIKIKSTQQQIQYEQVVLELNQQQKQLQLESEKISNRVSQSQNLAETAKARAELAKLMASPAASREEVFAAQLQLRAREQEGAGLRFQEAMLGRQQQLNAYTQQQEKVALSYQSQLRLDQARAERIKALPENQQDAAAAALKNQVLSRGRAAGAGTYVLPDINAARQNMQALVQEFQVPSLEVPVELQPARSQGYIEEQMRQLEPVRSQFEEMKRSFSPTTATENLSRRVSQLQQSYAPKETPQATVELKGRPIIEKVVIENVSTSIQNSQQTPGQDIEGTVFKTISDLTDRLQREFS